MLEGRESRQGLGRWAAVAIVMVAGLTAEGMALQAIKEVGSINTPLVHIDMSETRARLHVGTAHTGEEAIELIEQGKAGGMAIFWASRKAGELYPLTRNLTFYPADEDDSARVAFSQGRLGGLTVTGSIKGTNPCLLVWTNSGALVSVCGSDLVK